MPESASSVPRPHANGPLSGYRVIDLADEKGQLCARLLGELGADVIKVEPRAGHPTRANGPFYRDQQGPESSLYWWAMNAGKRSVTCELRIEAGRDLFHRLVAAADVVIETSAPGSAQELGAGPRGLAKVNPNAVVVSITNFGQTGPFRNLPATDIVGAAMGGHMYLNGSDERGPVRTTAPQAYAQANVQAAVGTVIALYSRGVNDGLGQHVDVSMQESMANAMDNAQQTWDILGINNRGPGVGRMISGRQGAALRLRDGRRLGGGAVVRGPHGAELGGHDRLARRGRLRGRPRLPCLARAPCRSGTPRGAGAGTARRHDGRVLPKPQEG